jgi:hypothetical protein
MLKAADTGSVEADSFREEVVAKLPDWNREVLPGAREINELEVDHYELGAFDQIMGL